MGMAQLILRGLAGAEATAAFEQLKLSLRQGAETSPAALLAGHPNAEGFWRPADGFWATIEPQSEPGRYYCTYGTIDPATKTKQASVCSINVRASEPWNPAGAFATDDKSIYYVHFGKNTGGNDFASRYSGQRATVRWDNHSGDYFVVAKVRTRYTAHQLGEYITARARFKVGGALEESYRSDFELGIAEAIQELETRLGGADVAVGPQAGVPSGGLHAGDISGPLDVDAQAARARLEFLKQLEHKLRMDPYLLATPVERISNSVRADRQRRLIISIGVTILSTGVGWLLSSLSPASVFGAGQALISSFVHLLP